MTRGRSVRISAWDDANPDEPGDEQEVLVTVPASFDPVARELTVVAAREAGFEKITLLEEPQAAFYAYLAARGDAWRKDLKPGDVVLVCDVGGGTTDFSLIERIERGEEIPISEFTKGLDPISASIVEHGGLFAYNRARMKGDVQPPRVETEARPMTIVEKIIARHAIEDGRTGKVGIVQEVDQEPEGGRVFFLAEHAGIDKRFSLFG